ncbi:hypothetical protein M0804_012347 [Polistes exclamans]|nr:hypothetical protein M0804_012347 [Polistes exclamans]
MERTVIIIGIISCYILDNTAFDDVKCIKFVNLKDEEILEISPYDNYYDDKNENEMIKIADIFNPEILKKDKDKYKPLHSYVKQYNQHVAKSKIQISDIFPYSKPNKAEIINLLQEEEPHIAGFKNQLNKRKSYQEEKSPPLIISAEEINKYIDLSTTMEDTTESTDKNDYDYVALKMDYEQQLKKHKNISDKLEYNYAEDKMTKKPFEGVITSNDTKYCTNKDMKSFGWCCCWFRCKICFPRERIIFVKQYYAQNPPGILIPKLNKKKPIKYEPSEFEQDMHEMLETAIKNI